MVECAGFGAESLEECAGCGGWGCGRGLAFWEGGGGGFGAGRMERACGEGEMAGGIAEVERWSRRGGDDRHGVLGGTLILSGCSGEMLHCNHVIVWLSAISLPRDAILGISPRSTHFCPHTIL